MNNKYDLFISYSRRDIKEVESFVNYLTENIPSLKCWIDIKEIEVGEEFRKNIVETIDISNIFLLAISNSTLNSEFALKELIYAKNSNKKIVPILLNGTHLLGEFLFELGIIDCVDINKIEEKEKLIKNISKWINKQPINQNKPQLKLINENNIIFTIDSQRFKMIKVEGGTFEMGSNYGNTDEKPIHDVTVSDYWISSTPVTQELWNAITENNPSYFKFGENLPVENINWNDCQRFITLLNELTEDQRPAGTKFRLPTEAEWEYAAKGGKSHSSCKYSGSNRLDEIGWYSQNSNQCTHAIQQKKCNKLGIFDMSGGLREWCEDYYNDYKSESLLNPRYTFKDKWRGSARVLRGGSWLDSEQFCYTTSRFHSNPNLSANNYGLRLVLSSI